MADKSSLHRVLTKCQENISNGNFYEAHQLYKSLYFRYKSQKRYDDAAELLYDGSLNLLNHYQFQSGMDLAVLLTEVYILSMKPVTKDSTDRLTKIFEKMEVDSSDRETFVYSCIQWTMKVDPSCSQLGHPDLHQRFAVVYWREKKYTESRYHFVHSDDGHGCACMLVEYHIALGYQSEVDLFITQAVLQYLCLKNTTTASTVFYTYTQQHPNIVNGPPYLLPLLNFVWLLLIAIEHPKLTVFAILCEKYEPSIKRDPIYKEYLDRIGQLFFGLPTPKASGNFLDSILQTIFSDDTNDSINESRNIPNTVMDLD